MTDAQRKFLEMSKSYEELKTEMKLLKPEMHSLLKEIGVNTYFQDSETMAVYKVEVPTGTFISFDEIGYKRTKLGEESSSGKLAKKEAQEQGFDLAKGGS